MDSLELGRIIVFATLIFILGGMGVFIYRNFIKKEPNKTSDSRITIDDEIPETELSKKEALKYSCYLVAVFTALVTVGQFRLGATWTGWAICDNNESVVVIAEAWRTMRDSGTKQHVYCVSPSGNESYDKRFQAGVVFFLMTFLFLFIIFWIGIGVLIPYHKKSLAERSSQEK